MNTQKHQTFHTDDHLRNLKSEWPAHHVSPATEIAVVIGEIDDGYPDYRIVRCGEIVTSGGLLFRIAAFTCQNTLLLRPHGLGHSPSVSGVEVVPHAGLFIGETAPEFIAQGGLIIMEG